MLDPLLIIRPDGAIRSLNDAACRLLGYSNTDLLNKPVDVLFSGEKNPLQEKGLKRILSGESVRDVELLFLGKNKESIPVLFSASLFKDKENQVVGVICGARDLTERKKLETRMLQSEKLSAVGQLAAGVAHEINNPLGIILGFSQSLTRRIEAGNVFEAPLKSIEREAIRCKTLVQDLLTFSRVTISDREPMDMNSAIEGALSLVKARAKIKQVDIRQELSPSIPKVFGNRGKIQQVIINLCNNAIDAMGNGGILTIETCSMEGFPLSWVCLKVTDNGSGIPHNLISRIFDPFFTTKPVGQGTGLGLSLVHEIVKSHSGLLDVISEPGHTVFTVKFPIKSPAEMEARMVAERLKEEKIMPSPRGGNRP
jgi:PAS domain S-box-containing protein